MKRVNAETGANSNNPGDPHQSPPEAYAAQLSTIVARLESTGAKLIFATTTPVPPGGVRPHRGVDDPIRYNTVARRIMRENKVAVNDWCSRRVLRKQLYCFVEIRRPSSGHHHSNDGLDVRDANDLSGVWHQLDRLVRVRLGPPPR